MNAVGIDVSKGKSMVAALRPFGEIVTKPFLSFQTFQQIHSSNLYLPDGKPLRFHIHHTNNDLVYSL